jgi:NAD(P)-dependent dehydrogenase (short-subunit alcohol dehydrogenase family)
MLIYYPKSKYFNYATLAFIPLVAGSIELVNERKEIAMKYTANIFISLILLLTFSAPAYSGADSPTVLISGSNRGIGFEFAKQYAEKGWNVIATARKPGKAEDLKQLAAVHSKLVIEQLDVTDVLSITELAKKYRDKPIDVLINNAGILGDPSAQQFGQFDYKELDKVMAVNVLGPLRISQAFVDNVAASKQKKIICMSSGLGSMMISQVSPELYFYKISKAGMNIAMGSLATDLRKRDIIVFRLAPGMVNTRLLDRAGMGGRGIEPQESVAGMIAMIEKVTPEMTKQVYLYNGKTLPF